MEARTLHEFRQAVSDVDVSAIYFHMFEARFRLGREENDFSSWIRSSLGLLKLADCIRSINPYLGSLERLRSSILTACDEFIAKT